jgi:hypothetical protein
MGITLVSPRSAYLSFIERVGGRFRGELEGFVFLLDYGTGAQGSRGE